jgi:pyruvate/2-oxoglutarate dehydrogenase complex dihydrolipoamide dehydrogenase (E3) component
VVLHDHVFMQFDRMISEEVTRSLERDGVRLEKNVTVKKVGTAVGNIFQ